MNYLPHYNTYPNFEPRAQGFLFPLYDSLYPCLELRISNADARRQAVEMYRRWMERDGKRSVVKDVHGFEQEKERKLEQGHAEAC